MDRSGLLCCVALCLASTVVAQEPRGEVFGAVKLHGDDDALRAWVGAKVVLVSHPFPFDSRIGVTDRIECALDDRARFRARLLQGRSYSAWAWREAADGARVFTKVVTAVRADMPVVLEPEAEARPAYEARITGVAAWRETGALRCVATAGDDDLDREEVEVTTDGTVTIPALPGERIGIDIRAADGMPIQSRILDVSSLQRDPRVAFELVPPHAYDVLVTDAQDAPLQGVEIRRLPSAPALVLARTAADGTAKLMLPRPRFVRRGLILGGDVLIAQAPGHAPCMLLTDHLDRVHGTMRAVQRFRGRIALDKAQPAAHVDVVLLERIENPDEHLRPAFLTTTARTDERGRFEFASWSGDRTRSSIGLVLPPTMPGVDFDPLVVDVIDFASVASDEGDLVTIDLHAFARIELSVREPDGSPASFALCRRGVADPLGPFQYTETRTDMRGRIRLLLRDTAAPIYLSSAQGSVLLASKQVDAQAGTTKVVEVDLRPRRVFDGKITTAQGQPVARRDFEIGHPPFTVRRIAAGVNAFQVSTQANAQLPLGLSLLTRFATDDQGRFEVAIEDFETAVDIRPWRALTGAPGEFIIVLTDATLVTIPYGEPTHGLEIVDPEAGR